MTFSRFIPQLFFIYGQPDMVKSNRVDKTNIFLREECCSSFTTPFTLRKPVCNICPSMNLEWWSRFLLVDVGSFVLQEQKIKMQTKRRERLSYGIKICH